jgi:UPF0755 protein
MRAFAALLVLLLLSAGAVLFVVKTPYGPARETFVEIPSGVGTVGIAQRLKQQGIIRSDTAFEVYRQLAGGTLKAGEYRFDHPLKLGDVYRRIARGDVYTVTVLVPEGFNIFDIAQAVQAAGLASAADFLQAEEHDTALIEDLSPRAKTLEGYLFPDTYKFSRHQTPQQMVAAMVRRFRQMATKLGLIPAGGFSGDRTSYDVPLTVIMASLIEKEVNVDAERGLVGGVFVNRLAAGMPLATDPSVIYAALLAGRWRGTIYQSDLQFDSPYNTYRHAGLPPGPIANPGVAALKAAMHPAATNYLYFVADAQGHSQFSVDLKEHARQVQAFREAEKQVLAGRQ